MDLRRSYQRNLRYAFTPLLLLTLLSSCTDNPEPNHANSDDRQLERISRQWSRVAGTKDVDAIVGYWTDDAIVMIPGMPTLRGKAAIRKYVEQSMKIPGFRIKWKPVEAHVSPSGDFGYLIERSSVTAPNAKGALETQEFRAVTIWRKEADGNWRDVVDLSVPD